MGGWKPPPLRHLTHLVTPLDDTTDYVTATFEYITHAICHAHTFADVLAQPRRSNRTIPQATQNLLSHHLVDKHIFLENVVADLVTNYPLPLSPESKFLGALPTHLLSMFFSRARSSGRRSRQLPTSHCHFVVLVIAKGDFDFP